MYLNSRIEDKFNVQWDRDYNPSLGKFISEDPIGFQGRDYNLYRYVRNEVLVKTDPSGLLYCSGCGKYIEIETNTCPTEKVRIFLQPMNPDDFRPHIPENFDFFRNKDRDIPGFDEYGNPVIFENCLVFPTTGVKILFCKGNVIPVT